MCIRDSYNNRIENTRVRFASRIDSNRFFPSLVTMLCRPVLCRESALTYANHNLHEHKSNCLFWLAKAPHSARPHTNHASIRAWLPVDVRIQYHYSSNLVTNKVLTAPSANMMWCTCGDSDRKDDGDAYDTTKFISYHAELKKKQCRFNGR